MLTASLPFDDSNNAQMLKKQTSMKLTFPRRSQSPVTLSAKELIM
jgi:hypothetical protein